MLGRAQFPNKIKSREVLYSGVDGEEDQFFINILHLHLDDNTPCLSPKALHSHWFQLLLGITVVPKEIKDNTYAKFRGENKEHYDLRENGEFEQFSPLKVLTRREYHVI